MRRRGAEDPRSSILDKGDRLKPAEVKSRGWKRAGGLLLKIQDANRQETQPLLFIMGLTCQDTSCPSMSKRTIFPELTELPVLTGANAWSLPTSHNRWFGYFRKMLPYKCLKTQRLEDLAPWFGNSAG